MVKRFGKMKQAGGGSAGMRKSQSGQSCLLKVWGRTDRRSHCTVQRGVEKEGTRQTDLRQRVEA